MPSPTPQTVDVEGWLQDQSRISPDNPEVINEYPDGLLTNGDSNQGSNADLLEGLFIPPTVPLHSFLKQSTFSDLSSLSGLTISSTPIQPSTSVAQSKHIKETKGDKGNKDDKQKKVPAQAKPTTTPRWQPPSLVRKIDRFGRLRPASEVSELEEPVEKLIDLLNFSDSPAEPKLPSTLDSTSVHDSKSLFLPPSLFPLQASSVQFKLPSLKDYSPGLLPLTPSTDWSSNIKTNENIKPGLSSWTSLPQSSNILPTDQFDLKMAVEKEPLPAG